MCGACCASPVASDALKGGCCDVPAGGVNSVNEYHVQKSAEVLEICGIFCIFVVPWRGK